MSLDYLKWQSILEGHFMVTSTDQENWSYLDDIEYSVVCKIKSWVDMLHRERSSEQS